MKEWGAGLMSLLPKALEYVISQGRDVDENKEAWYANIFNLWTIYWITLHPVKYLRSAIKQSRNTRPRVHFKNILLVTNLRVKNVHKSALNGFLSLKHETQPYRVLFQELFFGPMDRLFIHERN